GRPRGRLRGTTAPRSKISPPQTPHGSARSSAPARHSTFSGQPPQRVFATSRSAGTSANHRSGSYWRHGSSESTPTVSAFSAPSSGANARVIPVHLPCSSLLVDLVNRSGLSWFHSGGSETEQKLRPRIPVSGSAA